jgi:uncharacterized membrane protein HdeD (DUF308 family)
MQSYTPRESQQGELLDRHFGSVVALSVVLMLVGLAAVFSKLSATVASMLFLGTLFVIGGITQIVLAFSSRGFGGVAAHLIGGVLSVMTGVVLWRAPLLGAAAITLVVASWLIVSGVGQILHSAVERFPHWGMSMASGIVGALLGVLLFATFPGSGLWYIGLYVGLMFFAQGIGLLGLAMTVHREVEHMHAHA